MAKISLANRLKVISNTQLLIAALAIVLIFLVVFISLFAGTPAPVSENALVVPPQAAVENTDVVLQASTPPPLSTVPEARFHDVANDPNYTGTRTTTVEELLADQDQIIGASDFDALGEDLKIMLIDGILNYVHLNAPPHLYQLIIIKNSLTYDQNSDAGGFLLVVSNQQDTPDPDVSYNVTFTANPPAMNFAKQ